QNRQRQRCDHEDDRCGCRGFAQQRRSAARTKSGLAAAATEGAGPVGRVALLQEHDQNQKNANDNVEDRNDRNHKYFTMAAKDAGSRLAPPTSAPSMSSFFINAEILSGLTLPPYRMRIASAAAPP